MKTKYITETTKFLNIDKWIGDLKLRELFRDLKFEKSRNNEEKKKSLTSLFYGNYSLEILNNEKELRKTIINKYHDFK